MAEPLSRAPSRATPPRSMAPRAELRLLEQGLLMLRLVLRVVWLLVGLSTPVGAVTTGTTSISDGAENSSRSPVSSHGPDGGGLSCTASCLPRPGQRTGTAR
jgi:hypothetical protein